MLESWIIFPLIAAFLWACVNHLDKYLLDKYCKNRDIGGLVIFSGLIGLPVLIIILILNPVVLSDISSISTIFIILAGILYILGIIPYLYALNEDETSTVTPQMLMIPAFSLIFGFIFLNEKLSLSQLFGATIIVLGSILISTDIKNIRIGSLKIKIFLLMLSHAILIASNIFLFKYVALETSFISTVFWLHIGYCLSTLFIFVFIKSYRIQFISLIKENRLKILGINIIGEIITLGGNLLFHYSTLLVPIAIAEVSAEGVQPFFVLILGIIITKFFPNLGKENLSIIKITQKLFSIIIMISGFILIVLNTQ